MGLFGAVFGAPSKSQSGGQNTSVSGFNNLPSWAQNTLQGIDGKISGITADQFRPLAQTQDETNAFNIIRQGFAPTAQSLQSDIAMQQSPYQQYVIDEINRQSQGQNSVLQQNLNSAGQFGSNRQMFGANDIDLSRQNQIGGFLSDQFNNSLNNSLTTLPGLRAADAQGLLGIGEFQRTLDSGVNQAQAAALQAQAGILGGLGYTVGGTNSQGTNWSSSTGENKGLLGSLTSSIGNLTKSDERLKENIEELGEENGHKVYKYNYKGSDKKFIGVMAQDVMKTHPDAVALLDGYYAVDYNMIGVNFREIE